MNSRRLVALALALSPLVVPALSGCMASSSEPDDENSDDGSNAITTRYGVDYSWARPSPASLKSQGFTFAARYLSVGSSGKNLSRSEADALIADGIDVVANWEEAADAALSGHNQGAADAKDAASEAAADGQPSSRPIYFSVDFDATPGQQAAIDSYFEGVASVLGVDRTGAYGGYYVIQRLFDAGKIKWGWQTYAWSGGQWDSRAQLRQIENGIDNDQCDKDEAVAADFGQWGSGTVAPPPPPPPVGPPTAKPAAPTACGAFEPGQGLVAGQSHASCDGRFSLAMQTDGNLVLYRSGGIAMWATGTNGSDGDVMVMQGDGNFVLYGKHSNALWASHTNGHDGASLAIQDDGNLVVYASGKALWDSQTNLPAAPAKPSGCTTIEPGQGLTAGESFSSCSGVYTLAMQTDGNLVLYHNGKGALWATGTNGKSGFNAVMQGDGNFVLYDTKNTALWNSRTNGDNGASLAVQDDGNLVVYAPGAKPVWDSGTNGR